MSLLAIYVSSTGCGPCSRAREIGASLTGAYPDLNVEVIEVDSLGSEGLPDEVVAVPTYVLDGIVISLGNPHIPVLREKLAAAKVAGG